MTSKKSDSTTPCVLLVEDSRELSSAMIRMLKARGYTVVLATSYARALELIERNDLRFDAAVLDHRLPDGDSRELVTALAERDPCCSALVLTAHGEQELIRDYRVRGAYRYAAKPVTSTRLVALVDATIHDSKRWRREMQQSGADDMVPPVALDIDHASERLRHIGDLSPTETNVAYWVLQGLRDAEIAQKLGRAERTAKRHVSQVLAKLGVKNRSSLWAVLHEDSESNGTEDGEDEDDEDDPFDRELQGGPGHPPIAPRRGRHREEHLDPPHGAERAHVKFEP